MSADPKARLEDELRAYARTRRAQGSPPLGLHPAARKLLQDEVARTFRRREETTPMSDRMGWWRVFWPRLAIASAVCLVAAFGLLQLIPPKGKGLYQMATAKDQADRHDSQTPGVPRAEQRADAEPEAGSPNAAPPPTVTPAPSDAAPVSTFYGRSLATSPAERAEAIDKLARRDGVEARSRVTSARPLAPAQPPRESTPLEPSPARVTAGGDSAAVLMRQRYGMAAAKAKPTPPLGGQQTPVAPSTERPRVATDAKRNEPALDADQPGQRRRTAGEMLLAKEAASAELRGVPSSAPAPASAPALTSRLRSLDSGAKTGLDHAPVDPYATTEQSIEPGQRFIQIDRYRRNFNSPARAGVLQSFSLQPDRHRLIFRDADGSLYVGLLGPSRGVALQPATGTGGALTPGVSPANGSEGQTTAANAPDESAALEPQAFPFRVSGTNVTLNQFVVFEGRLIPATNRPGAAAGGLVNATTPPDGQTVWQLGILTNAGASSAIPQSLWPVRIQGRAKVGDTTEVEIEAVPVPQ